MLLPEGISASEPDNKGVVTLTITDGEWSHSVRVSPAPSSAYVKDRYSGEWFEGGDPNVVAHLQRLGHDLDAEHDPDGTATAVEFLLRMRDER